MFPWTYNLKQLVSMSKDLVHHRITMTPNFDINNYNTELDIISNIIYHQPYLCFFFLKLSAFWAISYSYIYVLLSASSTRKFMSLLFLFICPKVLLSSSTTLSFICFYFNLCCQLTSINYFWWIYFISYPSYYSGIGTKS